MCVNTWKHGYIDHNSDADGHKAKAIIKMFVKKFATKELDHLPGKWKNT